MRHIAIHKKDFTLKITVFLKKKQLKEITIAYIKTAVVN